MAHAAFDTLKYVETLTQAGMAENQAKALAKVQNEVISETLNNTIATKTDLLTVEQKLITEIKSIEQALKLDVADIKAEQKLMKWMLGFVLAGITSLLLKAFF
jgi:hypothetical protein